MIKTNHYTIDAGNLSHHELIGLAVRVSESTDSAKVGISGTVVDETQRTFVVETHTGEKIVPKTESTFTFDLDGEMVDIQGKTILYNPIERLKNGGMR